MNRVTDRVVPPSVARRAVRRLVALLILSASLLASLALLGCAHRSAAPEAGELLEVPADWRPPTAAPAVDGPGPPPVAAAELCHRLPLPELGLLAERLGRENLDLASAAARIERAAAVARQTRAALFPDLDAEAGATRSKSFVAGFGLPPGIAPSGASTQYRLSVAASYEVDLWNRLGHRAAAAWLDAGAAVADRRSLAVTLGAGLAESWIALLAQRDTLELLDVQLEASGEILELVELRFAQGQTVALDVVQQRQQLETLRAERHRAAAELDVLTSQLAVLLGTASPGFAAPAGALPEETPPPVDPQLPARILDRRPDLRAAWLRLEAADRRTAAEAADRLPRLLLTGSLFDVRRSLDRLLEELLWELAARAQQSLWSGGRQRAEIAAAEAAAEEALQQWGRSVLGALDEVSRALVRQREQEQVLASVDRQLESARRALRLARMSYAQGAADYLRILTTLESLQALSRQRVQIVAAGWAARVDLCRAVGLGIAELELEPSSYEEALAALANAAGGP